MKKIMTKKEAEDAIGYNVESAVQKTKTETADRFEAIKITFRNPSRNVVMFRQKQYEDLVKELKGEK